MTKDVTRHRAWQVDSLRTFAVLAVVFAHTIPASYRIGVYDFAEFGAYGVFSFFVISAFLITSQLLVSRDHLRGGTGNFGDVLKRFYARRALRLLPIYYLVLFAVTAADLGTMRQEVAWHAAMLSNILFAVHPVYENISPAGHFWSLSLEWQFYAVWPFVVLLLGERALIVVTAAVWLFSVACWSGLLFLGTTFDNSSIGYSIDALAVGAMLAIAVRRQWPLERWLWLCWPLLAVWLAGTALFLLGWQETAWRVEFVQHEAMLLAFAGLLFAATRGIGGWAGRVLDNRRLQYVGIISYGIYLYHQFVIDVHHSLFAYVLHRPQLIPDGLGLTIAVFAVSVAVAALSWEVIEQPINRWRHRFAGDRAARKADEADDDAGGVAVDLAGQDGGTPARTA